MRQLGDWGANVVRIERPGNPEDFSARHEADFQNKHRMAMAVDIDEQPVFLGKSSWELGYVTERFPKVRLERSKERA